MRLLVLSLLAACCSAAFAAAPDGGLHLSIAYPDPTFATITYVFRNDTAKPVQISSPESTMGFAKAIQITDAEGNVVPITSRTFRMGQEVMRTVPAHDVLRITAPAAPDYTLTRGALYIFSLDFATDIDGLRFTGAFPYGLPARGATLRAEKPTDPALTLAVAFTDPPSKAVTLELVNGSANAVTVVPPEYLGPKAIELLNPRGGSDPIDIIPEAPAGAARAIKPGATLALPLNLELSGTVIKPGQLYFAVVHYPMVKGDARFCAIVPVGMPVPKTAGNVAP